MPAVDRLEGRRLFEHPLSPAVMEVVARRGYRAARVEEFIAAGVMDRSEFERHFDGKADCVLRISEALIDDFEAKLAAAYTSSPRWPENLRAVAYEVARWIRDYPDYTWFALIGVQEAGPMARVRREEVFDWCAELIDSGRALAPDPDSVPQGAAPMAVGSIVEILTRHVQGTIVLDPVEVMPKLMYGVVRPYLGEAAARRELEIAPPADLAELPPAGRRGDG
jgi:AcrR family transcriptional regulator